MNSIHRLAVVLAAALLVSAVTTAAFAVTATWTCTNGNYSDDKCWNIAHEPCNTGPVVYDVIIPDNDDGAKTITMDLASCTVATLRLEDNATLKVSAGNSYSVAGQANVYGIVHGSGGDFLAPVGSFPGNRARIYAEAGSSVTIDATTYSSIGLTFFDSSSNSNIYTTSLMDASDVASLLDLSSVQSIDAGFGPQANDVNRHEIMASNGGSIDLSGLQTVIAPASYSDWIRFSLLGPTSQVLLPALTTTTTATPAGRGRTYFDVAGGTLMLPSLANVTSGIFEVDGGGAINAGPLASLANTTFILKTGGRFTESGVSSTYDSRGLVFFDGSSNSNAYTTSLMDAADVASLLDLSSIQSIDAGFGAQANDVNRHEITASNGGSIDLSGLQTVMAPASYSDWIRFSLLDPTSQVLLPALTTTTTAGRGRTYFDVAGGTLMLPSLTNVTSGIFEVDGGGAINAGPLASLANTAFILKTGGRFTESGVSSTYDSRGLVFFDGSSNSNAYTTSLMDAADVASLLDLSSIQSIDAGFGAQANDVNRHEITASNGGSIDLSGLQTVMAPASYSDWIRFSLLDPTSQVLLPALTTTTTAGRGRTYFDVAGGTLMLPSLTNVTSGILEVDGGGAINAGPLASLANTTFILKTGGRFTESGVSSTYDSRGLVFFDGSSNSNVYTTSLMDAADAASLLDLSSIQSIDAGFGPQANDVNRHEITASNGGSIDLSGLQTVMAPASYSDWIRFSLLDPTSRLLLPALTTTTTAGRGRTYFDVAGGTLMLPSLTNVTSGILEVDGGGAINAGPLASLANTTFILKTGGRFTESGVSSTYDSRGLVFFDGSSNSNVYTTSLMDAVDAASLLDLSSIQSIDAGFGPQANDVNRHEIRASNGGSIDLSGLQTVKAPASYSDWIRFSLLDPTSQVLLPALTTTTTAGAGRTYFDVTGGTLSLPSLTNVTSGIFEVDGGGTINAGQTGLSSTYDSRGLVLFDGSSNSNIYTTSLMDAADAASLLDLSSIQSIDAGFGAQANDVNRHEITASNGGSIDLSGLQSVKAPASYSDWIRFSLLAPTSQVLLPALTTTTTAGRGRTYFDVAGGTLMLPSLTNVTSGIFEVDGGGAINAGPLASLANTTFILKTGGRFTESGVSSTYDSRGLVFFDGSSNSNVYTTSLMDAADAASLLDLSSIQSIDAGFGPQANDVNRHEITASNGGSIDLSGLQTVMAPASYSDWIRFSLLDPTSQVLLPALTTTTTAGRGRTYFDVAGGTLMLPSLTNVTSGIFEVDGGGAINAGPLASLANTTFILKTGGRFTESGVSSTYDSKGLVFFDGSSNSNVYTTSLMDTADAASLLDLSSVQSIDAGFGPQANDVNRHEITASNNALVDLSSLSGIIGPTSASDWLRFTATNLGELRLGDAAIAGGVRINVANGGVLHAAGIADDRSRSCNNCSISLPNADVVFDVSGTLDLGPEVTLDASAEPETPLHIGRDFVHALTVESKLKLATAIVHMDGTGPQALEVASVDGDVIRPVVDMFQIGQLIVGQESEPTVVQLVDRADNGNRVGGNLEALYLVGLAPTTTQPSASGVQVLGGSTLSLGCRNAYVFADSSQTFAIRLNDMFGPGNYGRRDYDFGWLQLDADTDGDGFPDCVDNCPQVPNEGQEDSNGNGVGDACEIEVPLSDTDVVNEISGFDLGARAGTSVATAGDLSGDGCQDLLVGAPSSTNGVGPAEAGSVSVYFGSSVDAERGTPDIVFLGAAAHDRAGVSVAGNFDYNGDGKRDILIGAEQMNRAASPAVSTGNGKAYLIFFDPTDAVHYPHISDPTTPDYVDLSLVGVPGGIPGIVFNGQALGDRAGFSVAGGGRLNDDGLQDIVIGAPGHDVDGNSDTGAAYVVFGATGRTGAVSLDDLPEPAGGHVFLGTHAGDELGYSVAFPGDITGTISDDLALGAPRAFCEGQGISRPGTVYVIEGGAARRDITEVDDIGKNKKGTQICGTQHGEVLGYALAGAGDNLRTGSRNLLIGAPLYDGAGRTDAGRVIQTAARLPMGVLTADQVGAPANAPGSIPGARWLGAAAGDKLGSAVAGVGGVNGSGANDIAIGAPLASANLGRGQTVAAAGIVYVATAAVPWSIYRGEIDLADGFAGTQFLGTQSGENAGTAIAGNGDVTCDGHGDLIIGAPGKDVTAVGNDAGAVYIVRDPCGSTDTDGDDVHDGCDNCVDVPNPDQTDANQNGFGDACDDVPPERCNGLDENGNGYIDDGCDDDGDGYCDATMPIDGSPAVCPHGGSDCDDSNPDVHPGALDSCNGINDNCNGSVDEDFVSESTTCGVEACQSSGATSCVGGVVRDSCVPGSSQPEICDNGIDDDCDELIDLADIADCPTCVAISVNQGWNFVGPALDLAYRAQGICDDVLSDGGDPKEVVHWSGGWSGHICGIPPNDFPISAGRGYFLKAGLPSTWCQDGAAIASPVAIPISLGWNAVSIPEWAAGYTAESACVEIASQGGSPVEIVRWISGGWQSHRCGVPPNSFALIPGDGYFIRASAPSIWTLTAVAGGRRSAVPIGDLRGNSTDKISVVESAGGPSFESATDEATLVEGPFIANQTDSAFTVVWTTDRPGKGWVTVVSGDGARRTIGDARGDANVSRLHFVTVSGLQPESEYWVTIESRGGTSLSVRTGPTLGIPRLVSKSGAVRMTGDAVVLARRVDTEPSQEPPSTGYLAALVEDDFWSVSLGNLRTADLEAYLTELGPDAIEWWILSEDSAFRRLRVSTRHAKGVLGPFRR